MKTAPALCLTPLVVALSFPLLFAPRPCTAQAARVAATAEETGTFSVEGVAEKPGQWTAGRIRKELAGELKTVEYTLKGEKHTAECVPLLALVKAAGPRLDPKRKNHLLSFVAVARATDGYTVAFSLGEFSPEYGKRTIWVALNRDGQPFTGADAPVSLLAVDDVKSSRWVHGVRRILLVDTAKAADAADNVSPAATSGTPASNHP